MVDPKNITVYDRSKDEQESMYMTRINCYKVSRNLGLKVAVRAFLHRAFPAKILYGLFDEIQCPVCICDATGILLRSDFVTKRSEFLKYRVPQIKLTSEAQALLVSLEAIQLF